MNDPAGSTSAPIRSSGVSRIPLRGRRFGVAASVVAALAVVAAACMPASAPWTSDVPSGRLDDVSLDASGTKLLVRGWAGDRNASGPIRVAVYVNGEMQLPLVLADRSRPDVLAATGAGARSGFDVTLQVPKSSKVQVCAAAVNVGPGDHALLGCLDATPVAKAAPNAPKSTTTTSTTTTTAVPELDCDAELEPGVDLSGCDLSGVDLEGAQLSGATLVGTSFQGARLLDADFSGADLRGADFDYLITNADLGWWSGTTLSGSDFTGADLTGATMRRSALMFVILDSADLTGVDLTDAALVDFSAAGTIWSDTICPDGTVSDEACEPIRP